jgi:hypothetical protein
MLVLTCILVDFSRHPSVFTALKKPMSSNRSRIEFLGRIKSFDGFYPFTFPKRSPNLTEEVGAARERLP